MNPNLVAVGREGGESAKLSNQFLGGFQSRLKPEVVSGARLVGKITSAPNAKLKSPIRCFPLNFGKCGTFFCNHIHQFSRQVHNLLSGPAGNAEASVVAPSDSPRTAAYDLNIGNHQHKVHTRWQLVKGSATIATTDAITSAAGKHRSVTSIPQSSPR